jgi:hypothetical protein
MSTDECKYTVSGKTRLVKCSTKVAANYRVSSALRLDIRLNLQLR